MTAILAKEPTPNRPKKRQAVFGIVPVFFLPDAAGEYLGHSGEWLRLRSAEHDLFKPTIRGKGKGSPNFYRREHLDIIADHLEDREGFPADVALAAYTKIRRNRIQGHLEQAKTKKGGK